MVLRPTYHTSSRLRRKRRKAYALTLEAEKIYNKAFNGIKLADVKQAKEDYKTKDNVSSFYYEPIKLFDLKEYEESIDWSW